jgi:putative DNA primase/helicase
MTTKAKNIDGGPLAIARDFVSRQHTRDGLRTLQHWHGDFYAFNANTYHNLATEELTAEMWRFVELNDAPTAHKINDALAALAALTQVYNVDTLPQWLPDALHTPEPSSVVAFQNGLLDVSAYVRDGSNRLLPSTPSWFSVNVLPCNYVADADCPRWLAFLDDVLSGDRELVAMLSEWFGYCLTNDTSQQKALLMIGPPRSGKGTTIRTLRRMVGSDNCASPSLSSLGERFGLSSLLGKTNALCSDAHLGRSADSIRVLETLKSIIGEDDQLVDRKHKEALAPKVSRRRSGPGQPLTRLWHSCPVLGCRGGPPVAIHLVYL